MAFINDERAIADAMREGSGAAERAGMLKAALMNCEVERGRAPTTASRARW